MQKILVIALVVLAVVYLARRMGIGIALNKKGGCGSGCGCSKKTE